MRRDTNSLAAATAFAHSKSTHLLFRPAVRSLCATRRTHVPKRSPPPASLPARAGAVQSFRTSDSNTRSAPHALFLPLGIVPGHPPFPAPTRNGSPVSFPALLDRRLANPRGFLDSAAEVASVPVRGSAAPARRMFPRETAGFRSTVRTASCPAKKHRFADRIAPPAGCAPAKNNQAYPRFPRAALRACCRSPDAAPAQNPESLVLNQRSPICLWASGRDV